MMYEWLVVVAILLFVVFVSVKTLYYRSVAEKEQKNSAVLKLTLQEAEILIRKHQLQLQRGLGNIDILTDEITSLRNEVKLLKQRNSQYRVDTEKYKNRIKDLEQKIEALL